MLLIERNLEASAFFELAEAILECELGASHERTLTVRDDQIKYKKCLG